MTVYPIAPVAYPRMTRKDKWLMPRRPVVQAFFDFRDEIGLHHVEIPIPSKVTFWMQMPASWSQKKRNAMFGQPHTQAPDIDNILKALLDSVFQGNDAIVWSIWPQKMWSNNPGIEVLPL